MFSRRTHASSMILFVSVIVACMFAMTIADTTETPVVCDSPSQYLDAEKNECIDFTSTKQKASTDFSAELNSGNTAWLLASSAFVMIMTPGVAFFYAGLAGEEMASNTIMMSFVSMAAVSIQFFAFGYSVAFSPNGLFAWAGYNDVTGVPGGVYGVKIPAILFALFQTQFAMITPALLSGGIVGRMKFGTFIVFCLLWTTFVYGPLAHWMWSYQLDDDYSLAPLGWEAKMGSIDFAGGTVIHVSSGFGALVAAIVVGKRYNHGEPVKPHNVPLTMIGCTLLWFGWFGFNGGSAAAADGVASVAAMNTHLAACAGFLTWIGMEFIFDRKIDPCGAASGAVAGLVSITPGCGFVFPWASLIFGIVGAATAFGCVRLKNVLRYDDTLDSFGIHGCAGVMGGLLTGLFATSKINPAIKDGAFYGNGSLFVHQLVSQIIAAAYSAVVTLVILMLLKYTIGLRVSEDKERDGMDLSYHGGTAYASTHGPSSPLKNLAMANPPEGDFASLMSPGASTNPKTENVSANPV